MGEGGPNDADHDPDQCTAKRSFSDRLVRRYCTPNIKHGRRLKQSAAAVMLT